MGGGVSNIGLGFNFGARDLASGPINLLRGNFSRLHSSVRMGVPQIAASLGVLAGSLVMATAGVAGIRGAFSLAESSAEFGRSIADVGNVSQASAEDLQRLEDTAIRAGIATQFSPTAAAEGLRNLASNGLNARDAMDTLIPSLDLAAASGIDVGEAADVIAASLNAYSLGAGQATRVTDMLIRGTQLSALRADEFETVMGRSMATGRMFGQSMESVIIALGSMRSAGIPATVAATSFGEAARRAFTDQASQRELQRLGVAVQDAEGNFRNIADVMQDTSRAMADMTEAERARIVTEVFHVRGMQAFNAMANRQASVIRDGQRVTLSGAEAIAYYTRELENSGGTAAEARNARLRTFWGTMELLTGTVQTLGTVFGRTFGQVFAPLVTGFTNSLNLLIRTWRGLGDGMQRAIAIGFLVASGLSVVLGVTGVLGAAIVLLIGTLGSLLGVALAVGVGVAAAMLPITAAIAAVMAVGYGFYRAWQENLGGLHDFTDEWVDRIRRLWEGFRQIFSGRGTAIDTIIDMNERGETSMAGLLQSIENLYHRGRRFWNSFSAAFGRAWERMGPPLTELREALSGLLRATGSSAASLAGVADAADPTSVDAFAETLATDIVTAFADIARDATAATNAITELVELFDSPTWQAIADTLGTIAGALGMIWDLYQNFAAFTENLNPLGWIAAAGQALSGQDVTAMPMFNEGRRQTVAERIAMLSGTTPPESGTDRPAATGRSGGRSLTREDVSEAMRSNRAWRPVELNNVVRVHVDGRQVDEATTRNRIEQNTMSGDIFTGDIGLPESL